MKSITRSLIGMATLAAAVTANAGLIVNSINMEVRNSGGYVYSGGLSSAMLDNQFNSGSQVCSISIGSIDRSGSTQNCSGPNSNFATRFSIDLVSTGNTKIQFGPDWGRGGAIYTDSSVEDFTGNRWWGYNWGSSAVIEVDIADGASVVNFIGWEDCCAGANSARYSEDDGQTWYTLAVNSTAVSEPGTLAFLGLGMIGLGIARRKAK